MSVLPPVALAAALISGDARDLHEYEVEVLTFGYPTPVAVEEEPIFRTLLPTTNEGVARIGRLRGTRHLFSVARPWDLALASDGLLQRLGVGDEQAGRKVVRQVLQKRRPGQPLGLFVGADGSPADDESIVVVGVSDWDDEWDLALDDRDGVRQMLRSLHAEAGRALSQDAADRLTAALGIAIENVYQHAGVARFRVKARSGKAHVYVEVLDEGTGLKATDRDRSERGLHALAALCPSSNFRKNEPTGTVVGVIVAVKDDSDE